MVGKKKQIYRIVSFFVNSLPAVFLWFLPIFFDLATSRSPVVEIVSNASAITVTGRRKKHKIRPMLQESNRCLVLQYKHVDHIRLYKAFNLINICLQCVNIAVHILLLERVNTSLLGKSASWPTSKTTSKLIRHLMLCGSQTTSTTIFGFNNTTTNWTLFFARYKTANKMGASTLIFF